MRSIVARTFTENFTDSPLPRVRVPDWDLLTSLEDVFGPHVQPGWEAWEATDERGSTYRAATVEGLRSVAREYGSPIVRVVLSFGSANGDSVRLLTSTDWSMGNIESEDETFKNDVVASVRALFAEAALDLPPPPAEPEREPPTPSWWWRHRKPVGTFILATWGAVLAWVLSEYA